MPLRRTKARRHRKPKAPPIRIIPQLRTLIQTLKTMDFAKLKSRKLWMTIAGSVLVTLGTAVGMQPEIVEKLVALIAAYVLGQGIADHGAQGGSQG